MLIVNLLCRGWLFQLDRSWCLFVLSFLRQVVHLVLQHEVQILEKLNFLEVELFLTFNERLEANLHFVIISLL